MSFRLDLLQTVDEIRGNVAGVNGLDQRPNKVTIISRTWSGGKIGAGTPNDVVLELPQQLPVHQLTARDVSGSGGFYATGDIQVSHITPSDGQGTGFTPAQLSPSFDDEGHEAVYVVEGPLSGEYTLIELRTGGASGPPGDSGRVGRGGIYSYALVLRARFSKVFPT